MKYKAVLIMIIIAVFLALPALGQASTITYQGLTTTGAIHIYLGGTYYGYFFAGEMSILIDGSPELAYCIDLYHSVYPGLTFNANLIPLPPEISWCEIMYILENYDAVDDFWGAVIQVSIWKLIYGPSYVTVAETTVEESAMALIGQASGNCGLNCASDVAVSMESWANIDGSITALFELTSDGAPIAGQEVTFFSSGGVITSPPSGVGMTDNNGSVIASVLVGADPLPITIMAKVGGETYYFIDPILDYQELVTFGDPCIYMDDTTYYAMAVGDPRTIGFWKHQVKVAIYERGYAHIPYAELLSYLPINTFGVLVTDMDILFATLWPKKATMEQRAQQQCLATKLNVSYGQLGYFSMVDVDYDGIPDMYLHEAFSAANAAYYGGNPEAAKSICDSINNM